MRSGDIEVVAFHRDGRQDCFYVLLPWATPSIVGEFNADEELCCGDCSDGDIVFVADQLIEYLSPSLRSYEDGRVQDQAVQCRSSTPTTARTSCRSSSQARSRSLR